MSRSILENGFHRKYNDTIMVQVDVCLPSIQYFLNSSTFLKNQGQYWLKFKLIKIGFLWNLFCILSYILWEISGDLATKLTRSLFRLTHGNLIRTRGSFNLLHFYITAILEELLMLLSFVSHVSFQFFWWSDSSRRYCSWINFKAKIYTSNRLISRYEIIK